MILYDSERVQTRKAAYGGIIGRLCFLCLLLGVAFGAQARKFTHPGILHTPRHIERMRGQIEKKEYPAYGSFALLKNHHCSQADYKPFGPFEVIARDG